jgi:hypothetical protein
MVSGTHCYAEAVEQRAEIEMVDITHQEGDNPALLGSLSEDSHIGDSVQALGSVSKQLMLMA